MPDTRTHRGPHPEDAALFAPELWPKLREASHDLWWLLDRGYSAKSSLALVGNRFALTQRQRLALARCSCRATERDRRRSHVVADVALRGEALWIDGYNLLITIEVALGGGVILIGRDGACRDLASQHGTYRTVEETTAALTLIGEHLAVAGVTSAHWLLDRPVSNSGRLKQILLTQAAERNWNWSIDLEFSPDAVLSRCDAIVVSSDSAVLDRCARWTNLARTLIATAVPTAHVLELEN
jgi:hypothetical protein